VPSLGKRLQRLEASRRPNDEFVAERRHFIETQAFQHLSDDELRLVIGFIEAKKQGHELTSQQSAAAEAYAAALEKECQKLGYKSLAALGKHCVV
jgi:hypothetical protein